MKKDSAPMIINETIEYLEKNLYGELNLDIVAESMNYSKFYLLRLFKRTTGFTVYEYLRRRRLTESARMLTETDESILEIALLSGFESQQAFTSAFTAMYKKSPSVIRRNGSYYPLQLKITLNDKPERSYFHSDEIKYADESDVDDWMELLRLTVDGFPEVKFDDHREILLRYIQDHSAYILRDEGMAVGIMTVTKEQGSIDFLAVHPQYRGLSIMGTFIEKMKKELPEGKTISITTFREGDKADTGYRDELLSLGFVPMELLTEFGYPTERLVLR